MAFDCVMNKKNGKAYVVTTGNLQSRDRIQLVGMGIRNPEHTQTACSSLRQLSEVESFICFNAERILRGKKKMSENDCLMVALYRGIQAETRSM